MKLLWPIVLGLLAGLVVCSVGHAEPDYNQLADAIKTVEGVPYYGITSVCWKDYLEARKICIRTARHAFRDYHALKGLGIDKKGYLAFLADRYCPASADFKGNVNWKANMNRLYKGGI